MVVLSGDIILAAVVEYVLYSYGLWFSHAILGDALRLLFRMIPLLVSAAAFVILCHEWFVSNARRANSVLVYVFLTPLAVVGGFEVIVWWAYVSVELYTCVHLNVCVCVCVCVSVAVCVAVCECVGSYSLRMDCAGANILRCIPMAGWRASVPSPTC